MVWYALRQLRIERELACDDCVLEAGELPSEYAKQLVGVARAYQPHRPSVSVAMASSARLDDRVRAILDTARTRMPIGNRTAAALAITASLFVLSIVVVRPVARQADADEPAVTVQATDSSVEEASGRDNATLDLDKKIIVKGTVLKPDGSPAIGSIVRSAAGVYWPVDDFVAPDFEPALSQTTTNDRGEFEIEVDTMPFGKQPPEINEYWKRFTSIAASHEGFGPDAVEFNSIDLAKPITFRLVEDKAIRGRAIDLEGRPIANATVQVKSVRLSKKNDLSDWIAAVEAGQSAEFVCRHNSDRFLPRVLTVPGELRTDDDGAF